MDFFEELNKIADKLEDKKDKEILRAAAIKLIPSKPKESTVKKIPGWGYHINKLY